ncbi:MAG: PD-(D/E)XK nuclease family protein, partial [Pseudomonadota bacterium]
PVAEKVRQFLLPAGPDGPVELGEDLVVVPTRQAGRRLRAAMARLCAERGSALLSCRVVTPAFFLDADAAAGAVADATTVKAAWARVLMDVDAEGLAHLFPAPPPSSSLQWAMATGGALQSLRETLADGGLDIAAVPDRLGASFAERDRWKDMAFLEKKYLESLAALGLADPCEAKRSAAESPALPDGVRRVVVAAVPDPPPVVAAALQKLARTALVDVLVHAPSSMADFFDELGRPVPEEWQGARLEIPDAERNVLLAGSPEAQSRMALDVAAGEAGRFGPGDLAIGVPDADVAGALLAGLEACGIEAHDPAGLAMTRSPLFHLLDSFRSLAGEGSFAAFSEVLRHPDVLERLCRDEGSAPGSLLEQLDGFQNECLPLSAKRVFDALLGECGEEKGNGEKGGMEELAQLAKAAAFVRGCLKSITDRDVAAGMRSLLASVYGSRTLRPGRPEDDAFSMAAAEVEAALREMEGMRPGAFGLGRGQALDLLLNRLEGRVLYTEAGEHGVDLEGWLELAWNDAPLMIVTGMNEGIVPGSRPADVFLPDSLRRGLGLRDEAGRYARDLFMMQGLVESRRGSGGRAVFIAGRTGRGGEPLKPSRLLFACSDENLPGRAMALLGADTEEPTSPAASISFKLDPGAPLDAGARALDVDRMHVTAFRSYLACPFRFYLGHVLGMETIDPEKMALDALEFGTLVHESLQAMGEDEDWRSCGDEKELARFLGDRADRWVERRYANHVSLAVEMQLEAAKNRLAAAAGVQARLVGEGWEIVRAEQRLEGEVDGMTVTGKIDRIDRHRETGEVRILDYKTADTAYEPAAAHLWADSDDARDYARTAPGGRTRRWLDLQLPLYRLLVDSGSGVQAGGSPQIGYFNLPASSGASGVYLWEDFSEELLESARRCAEGVVKDIRKRRFWPPSSSVRYDDFEGLFLADADACFEAAALKRRLKKISRG